MNRKIVVNLGEQRFDRLIEENKFYIDKTEFIRELMSKSRFTSLTAM